MWCVSCGECRWATWWSSQALLWAGGGVVADPANSLSRREWCGFEELAQGPLLQETHGIHEYSSAGALQELWQAQESWKKRFREKDGAATKYRRSSQCTRKFWSWGQPLLTSIYWTRSHTAKLFHYSSNYGAGDADCIGVNW